MSEGSQIRLLTEREIEVLANSCAEREAFVKSTIVFVAIWAASFLFLPFIHERFIYVFVYIISLRALYVIVSFLLAFFAGVIARWFIKEEAYEKYYTFYKNQKTQEQNK
ncbi:MAG: hypothetical protein ACUVT5_07305 [Candidatus Bathyarchaeales archaeon]